MSEVIFTRLRFSISLAPAADRPSYDQLLHLKKPDGSSLRVIRWISSLEQWQCTDLAHMLLKDDDLVRRYQKECKDKNESVRRVLDVLVVT